MRVKRHKVTLRKSYVQYRWKQFLWTAWTCSRRLFFLALGTWLASLVYAFWVTTPLLRLQSVELPSDGPAALEETVGVYTGDHIFGFSIRSVSARVLNRYPELASVGINRTWNGSLRVRIERRIPLARLFRDEKWLGVDKEGVFFPLSENVGSELVILAGADEGADSVSALRFLGVLRATGSPWLSRIFKVKLTQSGETVLYLKAESGEIPVYWGGSEEEPRVVRIKAGRLERVLADETLSGGTEYIRFVSDTRIAVKPLLVKKSLGSSEKREKPASPAIP